MSEQEPTQKEYTEIDDRPMFKAFLEAEAILHLGEGEASIHEKIKCLKNSRRHVQTEFLKRSDLAGRISFAYLHLQSEIPKQYSDPEDRKAFLTRLFRYTAAHTIESIKEGFEDMELKALLNVIQSGEMDGPKNVSIDMMRLEMQRIGGDAFKRLEESINSMISLRNILKSFVLQSVPSGSDEQEKYPPPFDEADLESDEWRQLVTMSRRFGHALRNIFSIATIFEDFLKKIVLPNGELAYVDDPPVDLHSIQHQLRALDAFCEILTGYQQELLGVCEVGEANVMETLFKVEALLNSRVSQDHDDMKDLPIDIDCDPDVRILNVNRHKLIQLCLELAKGALEHEKVSLETLQEFRDSEEPYLSLKAINEVVDGEEVVTIVIADKGAPYNMEEIQRQSMGTVQSTEALTDFLTQRGVSVQVNGDDGSDHRGLGAYVSRKYVQEMHGDLSFQSSEEGNVEIVICIPREGIKSEDGICFNVGKPMGVSIDSITTNRKSFRISADCVLELIDISPQKKEPAQEITIEADVPEEVSDEANGDVS
ncbi:ATP-binding protein [Patescibacteria group bacterium]